MSSVSDQSGKSDKSKVNHSVSPSVLTPAVVITTYDDEEWENFVLEYLEAADPPYAFIDPKGGAGDKGRDIVAHVQEPASNGPIDIFQCKAYAQRLTPVDIWVELGKLCVFSHSGEISVPRKYRFVAPHGIGTKLGDLLTRPDDLRKQLIMQWPKYCEKKISTAKHFPLKGALASYVDAFDFSIVSYVLVHELLDQHSRTSHWHRRFRRDPPKRPKPEKPPVTVQSHELCYVQRLFEAYSDHLKSTVSSLNDLSRRPQLSQHFERSRSSFYLAESLNRFYRDQFPGGAFDDVKAQVFDGVIDTTELNYEDGLQCVRATVQQAVNVTLAQTDYTPYVEPGDKKGVCHHLANDDKLKWVKS